MAEFEHDIETAVVTGALGTVGSWVVDLLGWTPAYPRQSRDPESASGPTWRS